MRIRRHVYVDIDLGEIGDDDLIAELKERGWTEESEESVKDDLIWIHDALRDRRCADAMARLERIIWPVLKTVKPERAA